VLKGIRMGKPSFLLAYKHDLAVFINSQLVFNLAVNTAYYVGQGLSVIISSAAG